MKELIQITEAFKHIRYFDKNHIYIDTNTGEELISCTSFIKKFEQPFPRDFMLKKKSAEYGITPEELAEQWDKARIIGSSRGTIVHKYFEDLWQGKEYPIEYPIYVQNLDSLEFINYHKSVDKLKGFVSAFVEENDYLVPVKLELVLGDSDLNIAGQMDGLFWDNKQNCFAQIDIKTDKRIEFSNSYQNYKKPITHLEKCNMNKYQLQLSIYRYILEKNTDIKLGYSKILWLNHKNDYYELFPTNYLEHEVETLFKYVSR